MHSDFTAQPEGIRAGDRPHARVGVLQPRLDRTIVGAQDELRVHRNCTAPPFYNPDQVRLSTATRHEVNHRDEPLRRLELSFQNECALAVAAAYGTHLATRGQEPASVFGGA